MSEHEHERLSAYLDGELSPEEMSAVAAHVAACAECAARLAEFAAVDEAAGALAAQAPSGYFEALPGRMRARLEPRSSSARGVPVWTWAVAAALLLAVVTPLTISRPTLAPVPEAAKERSTAVPLATAPSATPDAPLADATAPAAPAPAQRPSASAAAPAANAPAVKLQQALPPAGSTRALSPAAPPSAPAANAAPAPVAEEVRKREEGFAPAPADAERQPAEPPPPARRDKDLPAVGLSGAGALSRVEPQSAPKRDAAAAAQETADRQAPPAAAGAREQKSVAAPAEPAAADGRSAESLEVGGLASRSVEPYDERDAALDQEWRRLVAAKPQSVAESRRLREELRRFVDAAPDGPHADAARVRLVEVGYTVWQSGRGAADEAVFRRDAAAYLKRGEDAKDKPRVRELLLSR